jgi:hypothetical protein
MFSISAAYYPSHGDPNAKRTPIVAEYSPEWRDKPQSSWARMIKAASTNPLKTIILQHLVITDLEWQLSSRGLEDEDFIYNAIAGNGDVVFDCILAITSVLSIGQISTPAGHPKVVKMNQYLVRMLDRLENDSKINYTFDTANRKGFCRPFSDGANIKTDEPIHSIYFSNLAAPDVLFDITGTDGSRWPAYFSIDLLDAVLKAKKTATTRVNDLKQKYLDKYVTPDAIAVLIQTAHKECETIRAREMKIRTLATEQRVAETNCMMENTLKRLSIRTRMSDRLI